MFESAESGWSLPPPPAAGGQVRGRHLRQPGGDPEEGRRGARRLAAAFCVAAFSATQLQPPLQKQLAARSLAPAQPATPLPACLPDAACCPQEAAAKLKRELEKARQDIEQVGPLFAPQARSHGGGRRDSGTCAAAELPAQAPWLCVFGRLTAAAGDHVPLSFLLSSCAGPLRLQRRPAPPGRA